MSTFDNLIFLFGLFVMAMGALFVVGFAGLWLAKVLVNLSLWWFPTISTKGFEDSSAAYVVIPLPLVRSRLAKRAMGVLLQQLKWSEGFQRPPTVNFRGPNGEFISRK